MGVREGKWGSNDFLERTQRSSHRGTNREIGKFRLLGKDTSKELKRQTTSGETVSDTRVTDSHCPQNVQEASHKPKGRKDNGRGWVTGGQRDFGNDGVGLT